MDYSTLTDQINSLITSETKKDWVNIPGGLDKVSESSSGAAWGIGAGKLYVCLLPCTGQWILEEIPDSSPDLKILDFTTDDSLVYVLWNLVDSLGNNNTGLTTKNGNNSGEWSRSTLAPQLTKLFNTSSYIWGQSGKQKYKLAKPGTTGNWITVADTSDVTITSASSTSLYGVDSKGVAYKTDEALQSTWTPIPQFKGVFTGILGEQDQSGIYGISNNQLQKCVGEDCETIPLQSPIQTLSPNSKHLWMTSTTQGNLGNIYMQDIQDPDLIRDTQSLNDQRDTLVENTKSQYEVATYYNVMSKQLTDLQKMLSGLITNKKIDTKPLETSLKGAQGTTQQLESALPRLLQILIIIVLIILVYLCSGMLGFMTHYIAFVVFIGGIYFVLSNGM
jgi:hypothetical protein